MARFPFFLCFLLTLAPGFSQGSHTWSGAVNLEYKRILDPVARVQGTWEYSPVSWAQLGTGVVLSNASGLEGYFVEGRAQIPWVPGLEAGLKAMNQAFGPWEWGENSLTPYAAWSWGGFETEAGYSFRFPVSDPSSIRWLFSGDPELQTFSWHLSYAYTFEAVPDFWAIQGRLSTYETFALRNLFHFGVTLSQKWVLDDSLKLTWDLNAVPAGNLDIAATWYSFSTTLGVEGKL